MGRPPTPPLSLVWHRPDARIRFSASVRQVPAGSTLIPALQSRNWKLLVGLNSKHCAAALQWLQWMSMVKLKPIKKLHWHTDYFMTFFLFLNKTSGFGSWAGNIECISSSLLIWNSLQNKGDLLHPFHVINEERCLIVDGLPGRFSKNCLALSLCHSMLRSLVKSVPVASLHPTPPKSKLRDALNRCILQRQNKLCPLFHNQRRKILMVHFHILHTDTKVSAVTISSSNSLQVSCSTAAL